MSRNKYNFDIEVKGQGHAEVMNVCDTSSYDDVLMCKICGSNTKPCQKPKRFDLEVKGQHMNSLMLIDRCAQYGMLMSKQTEVMGRTRRLEVKGQFPIRIMNVHVCDTRHLIW